MATEGKMIEQRRRQAAWAAGWRDATNGSGRLNGDRPTGQYSSRWHDAYEAGYVHGAHDLAAARLAATEFVSSQLDK